MSVTQADLNAFHQFALGKISNGGAESLPQLMEEWTAQTEYAQTVAAVRQGVADGDAGREKSVEQAFADVRKKLGRSS